MLKEAQPSREIEVINTAMTAINSHVVYEVARSIPQDSIDFAIVLMGNNEVIGPYGPGTFNQNFLSNLGLIRFLTLLRTSNSLSHAANASRQQSAVDKAERTRSRPPRGAASNR